MTVSLHLKPHLILTTNLKGDVSIFVVSENWAKRVVLQTTKSKDPESTFCPHSDCLQILLFQVNTWTLPSECSQALEGA